MDSTHPTRILASISVPDTPTITSAIAFARANLDDHTYNHVMRSWLIGQATITQLSIPNIDLEAFAIAALLHDLGWSKNEALVSPDKRFEVDGANAAREFLKSEGWEDEERIQLVWDAIALHCEPSIALHGRPIIGLITAGVMAELFSPEVATSVIGSSHIAASMQEWEAISKEFPRGGLKVHVRDTLTGLCRTKPEATYNTFVADFGERYLADEGYSQVGKRVVDLLENATRE